MGRSASCNKPDDLLDISFEDAARCNLSKAEAVVVEGRYGTASLRVRISDAFRPVSGSAPSTPLASRSTG